MQIPDLSIVDRLQLSNQFEILFNQTQDKTYETKAEILRDGYEGLYYYVFNGISPNLITKEVSIETDDILQLYRTIDNAYAKLTPAEQAQLSIERIKFEGFDGNHDDHYHYMKFIVEKLDKWDEYKEAYINSHSSITINKYRRMLDAYNGLGGNTILNLGFDGLQAIVNAV